MLLNVYLLTRQQIWAWPLGIVAVALYAVIFLQSKLYSDFILQIIYFFLNAYGWWYWSRGVAVSEKVPVTTLSKSVRFQWLMVIVLGFIIWGATMSRYTDADFAYFDAFTTVASLVAQYLLAKKKIENWILWIVVDLISINIYLLKGLYYTSALYFCLMILCIMGIRQWSKELSLRII